MELSGTSLCIVCLSSSQPLKSITSSVTELHQFSGDYSSLILDVFHLGVNLENVNGHLCEDCINKLKEAYQFRAQVISYVEALHDNKDLILVNDACSSDDEKPLIKHEQCSSSDESIPDKLIKSTVKRERKLSSRSIQASTYNLKKRKKPEIVIKWTSSVARNSTFSLKPSQPKLGNLMFTSSVEKYSNTTEELTCPKCQWIAESTYQLHKHMNEHEPNYMCDECGTAFRTKASLRAHKDSHRPGPHKCDLCQKEFGSINTLRCHKRAHRTTELYPCKICGENLKSYHSRRTHLSKVHNIKLNMYKCNQCEKSFITATKRSSHIKQTHLKLRAHQCPHCDLKFLTPSNMRAHLANAHGIGEKHHKCDFCEKRFTRRYTLLEHMRIHTKDFRFGCHLCEKRFIQKCSLKSHLRNNHNQEYQE